MCAVIGFFENWSMAQAVERLLCKREDLSSNPKSHPKKILGKKVFFDRWVANGVKSRKRCPSSIIRDLLSGCQ
jgi:hypothetical protein